MTGLLRRRWVRVVIHLLVIAGLVASGVITWFHEDYMTRGTSFGVDTPVIPQTDLNPLGVNTFLHQEPDPEVIERSLDMIADAGFGFIRQIFVWSEIEPEPDTYWNDQWDVSTWEKYDRIVDMAAERGLEVVARLDKPPRWARDGQPRLNDFPDGPPNDYQDFAGFVETVVERYEGQVTYVQLWNEPNLEGEWGGQEIDPVAFTDLLETGYRAAKQANPDVQVLMPGLAPTDQTGPSNLSDLLFFEEMYEAGAADYFDIATVMVYGYGFSPWDRRLGFERNNFSRHIQMREIMEHYGDDEKPIWATEYNWIALPDDWEGDPSPWGEPVSEQEQAEYLFQGFLRAQQEWPWMGPMMVWGFRWPTDPAEDPEFARNPVRGFRLVDYDFTPRPAYERLSESRDALDRAHTGAYAADSRYLEHDERWRIESEDDDPVLSPVEAGGELVIRFTGTTITLDFAGSDGAFAVELNGTPVSDMPGNEDGEAVLRPSALDDGGWRIDGLADEPHTLRLIVLDPGGDNPLSITGFRVERRPLIAWIYPWIYGAIGLMLLLNLISLAVNQGAETQPIPQQSPHRVIPGRKLWEVREP